MSKCKSCGADITWVKMMSGKSMPCDSGIIRYIPEKDTTAKEFATIVTPEGHIEKGVIDPAGRKIGYVSHFATCPNAASHRRAR